MGKERSNLLLNKSLPDRCRIIVAISQPWCRLIVFSGERLTILSVKRAGRTKSRQSMITG